MTEFEKPYREPLAEHSALWADLYGLTMSQAFFSNGKHDLQTTFHTYIRKEPFNGGYLVTGGQNIVADWLANHWRFDESDLAVLSQETVADPRTGDMKNLFTPEFLEMVADARMELSIDAMPEGEIAFRDEPIYRVHGPLWQCLMVEAALLNTTNSQSLFATLAARMATVAGDQPILEFGLRRAQDVSGLSPSRGAYIGGVAGVSNMLARKYYGISPAGTFAHAFVMVYEDELEAFADYAKAMPYSGVFLVDTYDTLEGVKKAMQACQEQDIKLKAIRLDSGDLAYLSRKAREIMDEAGFADTLIAASNDLDEHTIASLKEQGARIDIWGVGTNLVTSKSQPALGAVYKLGAVYNGHLTQEEIDAVRSAVKEGTLTPDQDFIREKIKLSEQKVKTTIPGELDVLRYLTADLSDKDARFHSDTIISNLVKDPVLGDGESGRLAYDIVSEWKDDDSLYKVFNAQTPVYRPLKPLLKNGALVGGLETAHDARKRAQESLRRLDSSHKRFLNPHIYVVGIEKSLREKRNSMIKALRQKVEPQ